MMARALRMLTERLGSIGKPFMRPPRTTRGKFYRRCLKIQFRPVFPCL